MRVLIYAHAFAPSVGGAQTYVMHLARGLAERLGPGRRREAWEARVTLATPTAAGTFDDATAPFGIVRGPGLRALWRLVGDTDVLQLAGPALLPLALGLLRRKPVVVEHHGYQAVCPNGLLFHLPSASVCPGHFQARRYLECLRCNLETEGRLGSLSLLARGLLRHALSRRATANVAVSSHVATRLDLPRTTTIPHGIPDPGAGRCGRPGSPPPKPLVFAFVGRFVTEKGVALLLEAARQLKAKGRELRLKLIGDGPDRAGLEALTDALGLRDDVTFTGTLEDEALEDALADVAAVVMPTLMEETAGLAAMEQMMRGRVVVAADTGGLGESVGEAGLKFAPGDPASLAAALDCVLRDPGALPEIGARGRERALRRFHWKRMTQAHAALYRRSLGRPTLLDSLTLPKLRALAPLFHGRVLDVGCGDKPYMPDLAGAAEAWVGLDLSTESAADVVGDGRRLPVRSGAFDAIMATLVLDDLPEPPVFFAEAHRALRAGGHLVVTAPQCAASHDAPRDYFRFTRHGLERLALGAGLEIVSLEPLGGTAAHLAAFLLRHRPVALSRLASRLVQAIGLWLDEGIRSEADTLAWMLVCRRS